MSESQNSPQSSQQASSSPAAGVPAPQPPTSAPAAPVPPASVEGTPAAPPELPPREEPPSWFHGWSQHQSTGETRLLASAVLAGGATGLAAIGFRELVHLLEHAVLWLRGVAVDWGATTGLGVVMMVLVTVLAPAAGGLLIGWVFLRRLGGRGGHGVPAVIKAAAGDHKLDDWRMAVKAGGSVVTIGSGGSAGPEGPIVELGAVAGSYLTRWLALPATAYRTMMGCGAAAGIAAIFDAPVAGAVFVLEVVMRDFSVRLLVPLMLAAVTAGTVARNWYGDVTAFAVPRLQSGGAELWVAPLMGLMCGVVSALFIASVSSAGRLWSHVPIPLWSRPAVGGLLVGLLMLTVPGVAGEGYSTIESLLRGGPPASDSFGQSPPTLLPLVAGGLLMLLVFKILASALTLGSGAPGGAFAPSLVLGATTGLLATLLPAAIGWRVDPGIAGLMGIAGLIAGTFQAPLSGLLIVMGMTADNRALLVPTMTVAVLSSWMARRLAGASVYDLMLLREGLDPAAVAGIGRLLAGRPLRELIHREAVTVRPTVTLGELIDLLGQTEQTLFPVTTAEGACRGVVLLDDVRTVLRQEQIERSLLAEDLMRPAEPTVQADASLASAWEAFSVTDWEELPVLEEAGPRVVGLLRRADLDHALRTN